MDHQEIDIPEGYQMPRGSSEYPPLPHFWVFSEALTFCYEFLVKRQMPIGEFKRQIQILSNHWEIPDNLNDLRVCIVFLLEEPAEYPLLHVFLGCQCFNKTSSKMPGYKIFACDFCGHNLKRD